MLVESQKESRHYPNHYTMRDGDHAGHSNSVALEIGKDFQLPDSSVMSEADNTLTAGETYYSSSSPPGSDSQSQLHPSDEENSFILLRRREKNRKAAQKCREKKKERIQVLENAVKDLNADIRMLMNKNDNLEKEKEQLKQLLAIHERFCSLKIENEEEFLISNSVEQSQCTPSEDQFSKTSHPLIYTEQRNIPTSFNTYLCQA